MDLALLLTAFTTIFVVELPDKTFIATLVLATRYRPLLVWIGVASAFLIQTLVAVTLGGFIGRLPRTPVEILVAALFLVGGIILLRGAAKAKQEEAEAEHEFEAKARPGATGLRAVTTSFLVLFLAEWGDLSQLFTAGLVVKYDEPVSIGLGAFAALALVSGLAALLGRTLLRYLPVVLIRRIGGVVCLILAAVTVLGVLGLDLPIL
ncbi:TMEM165/GDT1 family protein [Segeticoccus rhizosphaerae]|jgi:putative Ca2+/H+ antiporter (TMEM165/GDT1 family)|uniref:TMEM165/GDT1 family protein n=1 Tax=Segeticoccus rhizosphaerae TaxID=1104777 RepID=UPI0010C086AE|nr:TMEM165/GDT1 family protein [Ornithinicoccus soli]